MSKILRSYSRLFYVFSFILYLNTYFCSPISDVCVNAGEKGSFWKHSGAEGGSAQKWLERRDVETS